MDSIERIKMMEEKMNRHQEVTNQLLELLEKFGESFEENYKDLDHYYGSQEYQDDLAAYDQGKVPEDVFCGVLSEDGLWDLFGDNQEILAEFLELSCKLVRRY